ncbi:MAG: type II secretion system F family protein [Defluviitaleaceae bacterium]|nr:type II secretion system F family protein [Defluviitaleaceae bacterium]MCL2262454.1 type II secretion system F family protein [Defluviitaleaceae bacterium]
MAISPQQAKSTNNVKSWGAFWHIDILDLLNGKGLNVTKKVSQKELAVFCRNAAFLLGAGYPIKKALPLLAEQSSSRVLCAAVSDVHTLILQGESFSNALRTAGVFPPFMCGYVAIGERTSSLPQVCVRLADYFETRAETREEFAAAMIYPAMVSVLMLAVVVLAVVLVLPGYARIFASSGVDLPFATAVLLSFSDFLAANTLVVIFGFFATVCAMKVFFQTKTGQTVSMFFKIRIPIWRHNTNCNIAQVLSLLLSSGLSISESVPMCAEITGNTSVKNDLGKLSAAVNSGADFFVALEKISYINPLMVSLVRVGETTGSLPQTMEKCNTYLEHAYRREIRRINKLITPVLTLVIGAILAAVMLAIILPTFELATAM